MECSNDEISRFHAYSFRVFKLTSGRLSERKFLVDEIDEWHLYVSINTRRMR